MVADALSRISATSDRWILGQWLQPRQMTPTSPDYRLTPLFKFSRFRWLYPMVPHCCATLLCDISTGIPCPFVPRSFRRLIFDALHLLPHPGIRATQRLVTQQFVWPGVNADARKWACSCLHRHMSTPPATFATPDACFS